MACKISLGGDPGHILWRGPDRPVSWPEVQVLQQLHGESSVFDAEFVRAEPMSVQMEKMRLLGLYGTEAVNMCYPGARPIMEMPDFPGDRDPIAEKRPSGGPCRPRTIRSQSPTTRSGLARARRRRSRRRARGGPEMARTVHLLVGCPGSGKTWVADRLGDQYEVVPHDLYKAGGYVEAIKNAVVSATRPILAETPFSISRIKIRLKRRAMTSARSIYPGKIRGHRRTLPVAGRQTDPRRAIWSGKPSTERADDVGRVCRNQRRSSRPPQKVRGRNRPG